MKKIVYSVLFCISISAFLWSCSSGAYVANSSSPANNSVNPLNPLTTSQFTWTGVDPVSCNINGTPWVADSATYSLIDSTGANVVLAYKNKKLVLSLYLVRTWQGSLYNMGYKQYNTTGTYFPDSTLTNYYYSALGNSGELYMQKNDTVNFQGRFYFQAVNTKSQVVNISNGYFNLKKY
jgi:hypothetical protein